MFLNPHPLSQLSTPSLPKASSRIKQHRTSIVFISEFVNNEGSQAPTQTYLIRICILTSAGDTCQLTNMVNSYLLDLPKTSRPTGGLPTSSHFLVFTAFSPFCLNPLHTRWASMCSDTATVCSQSNGLLPCWLGKSTVAPPAPSQDLLGFPMIQQLRNCSWHQGERVGLQDSARMGHAHAMLSDNGCSCFSPWLSV